MRGLRQRRAAVRQCWRGSVTEQHHHVVSATSIGNNARGFERRRSSIGARAALHESEHDGAAASATPEIRRRRQFFIGRRRFVFSSIRMMMDIIISPHFICSRCISRFAGTDCACVWRYNAARASFPAHPAFSHNVIRQPARTQEMKKDNEQRAYRKNKKARDEEYHVSPRCLA